MSISPEAQKRLDRIAEYEKKGYFDKDINDDPPTRPLKPGEEPPASHLPPPSPQTKVKTPPLFSSADQRPAPRPRSQYLSPPRHGRHWTYTDSAAAGNDPATQKPEIQLPPPSST